MPTVIIYASVFCPYCRRALALLDSKGVAYTVMDVDRNPQLWQEMAELSRRNTVPQIFIDDLPIGGFDELSALDKSGKLDALLGKS